MIKHRRQFIIGKYKFENYGFINIRMKNGLFLSYSKDLNVTKINKENSEEDIYLLGHAFQVDPKRQSPILDIQNNEYNDIEECYESWSGRWILIYNNEIHMDTCGTLGVFYVVDNDKIWISSSCSLLKEVYKTSIVENITNIQHGKGMDWYPGPKSILKDVNRLLPSQIININDGSIELKFRDNISIDYKNINDEEKIKLICIYLEQLMINISEEYNGDIVLPLTAGYDSRTILSVILKSKINFSTLTLEHNGISNSDIDIPMKLSKCFNFKHEYIKRFKELNREKLDEFDNHTLGNCVDEDRLFYGYDQFPKGKSKILLRGGIWEISRGFYDDILTDISNISIEDKLSSIRRSFHGFNSDTLHEESIRLWLKNIEEYPMDIIWTDRLYLEQRVGGWLSSIEQALDLTDFDRIHPLNSKKLISLLMSLSDEYRENKKHQIEIIKFCEPKLLQYEFNKQKSTEIIRNKVKIAHNIYTTYGINGIRDKLIIKFKKHRKKKHSK